MFLSTCLWFTKHLLTITAQYTITAYTYTIHLHYTLPLYTYTICYTLTLYTYTMNLHYTLTAYMYTINLHYTLTLICYTLTLYTYTINLHYTLTAYTYTIHLLYTPALYINCPPCAQTWLRTVHENPLLLGSFAGIISLLALKICYFRPEHRIPHQKLYRFHPGQLPKNRFFHGFSEADLGLPPCF